MTKGSQRDTEKELESCHMAIDILTEECNKRGHELLRIQPHFKKLFLRSMLPLLIDLERDSNKDGMIYIGEESYSYPEMAKLIRDMDPNGVSYAMDWVDAIDHKSR